MSASLLTCGRSCLLAGSALLLCSSNEALLEPSASRDLWETGRDSSPFCLESAGTIAFLESGAARSLHSGQPVCLDTTRYLYHHGSHVPFRGATHLLKFGQRFVPISIRQNQSTRSPLKFRLRAYSPEGLSIQGVLSSGYQQKSYPGNVIR